MEIMEIKKSQNHINIFSLINSMNNSILEYKCEKCNYKTNNKYDFKKHKTRQKHLIRCGKKTPSIFVCEVCSKKYKSYSGLWKHNKTCYNVSDKNTENNEIINTKNDRIIIENQKDQIAELKNMMSCLLQDNKESRNLLKELMPKMGTTVNHNYNNKISINVFLNTYCKDAINFQDFIDKMQVSVEDLLHTKEIGYSKGITNIFMKNLKNLEINERPIHCSDKKRLQFYVKEEDTWNKDDGEKVKMAISKCHKKQIELIKKWEDENPGWKDIEQKRIEYIRIINEIMGGTSKEEIDKNNKDIIKNISDKVLIKDALPSQDALNI